MVAWWTTRVAKFLPTAAYVDGLADMLSAAGRTQTTIARELRVDPALVNRWARTVHQSPVPLKYLDRLSELLEVDLVVVGDSAIPRGALSNLDDDAPPISPAVGQDARPPAAEPTTPPAVPAPLEHAARPAKLLFGIDGMALVPMGVRAGCSCGR